MMLLLQGGGERAGVSGQASARRPLPPRHLPLSLLLLLPRVSAAETTPQQRPLLPPPPAPRPLCPQRGLRRMRLAVVAGLCRLLQCDGHAERSRGRTASLPAAPPQQPRAPSPLRRRWRRHRRRPPVSRRLPPRPQPWQILPRLASAGPGRQPCLLLLLLQHQQQLLQHLIRPRRLQCTCLTQLCCRRPSVVVAGAAAQSLLQALQRRPCRLPRLRPPPLHLLTPHRLGQR